MNIFDKILGIFTGRRADDDGTPTTYSQSSLDERGRRYGALKQRLASQMAQPQSTWSPALTQLVTRADTVVVNQAVTPVALAEWLAFVGPRVPADAQGWFAALEIRARNPQVASAQASTQATAQSASAQGDRHVPVPATSGLGNYVRGW